MQVMHKAITLLFVFTLFGAGCSSTATPPSSAPTRGAPAPPRPQEPAAKVTAVPQSAPAIGQALVVSGGATPAENPLLGRRKDGRPVTLAEYRGRAVLVNFWSSRCPPCAGELTTIEGLRRQYENKGLMVLAVNFGEKTVDADRFLARQRLPLQMTQLLDPDRGAARGLGVRAVPTTLLFDAQGRLVSRYGGYSGLDVKALRAELDRLLARRG
jgi:thiol-disulfide isomerase/thioredoxin